MRAVMVGHTVFTLAMFGLMWAVQVVVYPQFRNVAPADFADYAATPEIKDIESGLGDRGRVPVAVVAVHDRPEVEIERVRGAAE